jgi:hypothetical protein
VPWPGRRWLTGWRWPEARRLLAELLGRLEREYVSPYDIAAIHAALGARDETFKWLRRAAEERSTFIVHLGWDGRFEPVRQDERYRALLERELKLRLPVRPTAIVPGAGPKVTS